MDESKFPGFLGIRRQCVPGSPFVHEREPEFEAKICEDASPKYCTSLSQMYAAEAKN